MTISHEPLVDKNYNQENINIENSKKNYTDILLKKVEERARKKRNRVSHTKKNSKDMNEFGNNNEIEESTRFTSYSTFDNRANQKILNKNIPEDYDSFIQNISQTISQEGGS
mmetsp:Transcript_12631/g.11176  ORF Transcript_12631/g.11176 Transcript_12631/m.11176 type:complete len:112 (+) Transcript_12631:972-1307(+)